MMGYRVHREILKEVVWQAIIDANHGELTSNGIILTILQSLLSII